ncbi:hypothetical protein [Salisaeta longa]|uniref:hypothetical protein n=1 Tax=Salisaeta longa TaxID=503170 RepID=UPI0003B58813|nr:hypothetical protein [Salisaeta longa]
MSNRPSLLHAWPAHRHEAASFTHALRSAFRWTAWERLITRHGLTIDRPKHAPHPEHPSIIYPLNYGYVNGTHSTDGEPVDCFVGDAPTGLVGLIWTTNYRTGCREAKLLYRCTPADVYTAHGFINYAPSLLTGHLVMRRPMRTLWTALDK